MTWDAAGLARTLGGRLVGDAGASCHRVTIDTRWGLGPGDAFVALVGERRDGAEYVARALEEGASVVLAQSSPAGVSPGPGQALVLVPCTRRALQQWAAAWRRGFTGHVLGITGSNGKTTVKEMLRALVPASARVAFSPLSWNSQVGVPLSLLSMPRDVDWWVVECGISLPGEMATLAAIVRPTHGVWTCVGEAHASSLGGRHGILREKAQLFSADVPVWLPEDEEDAREVLSARGASPRPVPVDCRGAWEELLPPHVRAHEGQRRNACLARALVLALGWGDEDALRSLSSWASAPMRWELVESSAGVTVLNDAYSWDAVSLRFALLGLLREQRGRAAWAVLAPQGAPDATLRLPGLGRLAGVVLTGDAPLPLWKAALEAAGLAPGRVFVVRASGEVGDMLRGVLSPGDVLLLKGSRRAELERVLAALLETDAPTRALVDLDALVDNYRAVAARVGPSVAVWPVLKAFAYGLDALRVARALERAGAGGFVVAFAEEGAALRSAGVGAPILVQHVLPTDAVRVGRYGLAAEVVERGQLAILSNMAAQVGCAVAVHIKVETGLGRVGFQVDELAEVLEAWSQWPALRLEGLMTHFAAADDPAEDAYTQSQMQRFRQAYAAVVEAGHRPTMVHAANSAGAARFSDPIWTAVRVGIALYGGADPAVASALGTRGVVRVVTQVLAVRSLPRGAFVGYGRSYEAARPTRVATVAIGYADGYPRAVSNRGWMVLHGQRAPVIGRVCMDVTMVDVTDIEATVCPGDEVVVIGHAAPDPTLHDLASWAETIPYEILTRISPRVRRVYVRETEA